MQEFRFRHRRPIVAALLLLGCLIAAPRGAAAQDARSFIAHLGNQAIQVMGPSVPAPQRAAIFRQIFERDFDLPEIGRFVLGHYRRGLSPDQQREFQHLFRDYLVQSYTSRFAKFAGEPFQVTGTRQWGSETVVNSRVLRRSGKPIELDWHVVNADARFLITDVVVDGVSMKLTQRNEFAGIIERNGGRPDALLAALRQQLAEGP